MKLYDSLASKQRAYRQRKKAEAAAQRNGGEPPDTDEDLEHLAGNGHDTQEGTTVGKSLGELLNRHAEERAEKIAALGIPDTTIRPPVRPTVRPMEKSETQVLRELRIVDESGRTRWLLTTDEGQHPVLLALDDEGRPGLAVMLSSTDPVIGAVVDRGIAPSGYPNRQWGAVYSGPKGPSGFDFWIKGMLKAMGF